MFWRLMQSWLIMIMLDFEQYLVKMWIIFYVNGMYIIMEKEIPQNHSSRSRAPIRALSSLYRSYGREEHQHIQINGRNVCQNIPIYLQRICWLLWTILPEQPRKVAMCFRNFPHADTDTNMYEDSFHNRLKTFYMQRQRNRRLDDLVNLLLQIEGDDFWRHNLDVLYDKSENM